MKRLAITLSIFILLSGCDVARGILGGMDNGNLSRQEVVSGLKQALVIGTDSSTVRLALLDGFYKDDMIRILLPPEAAKVETTLRNFGLGSLVDKTILSLNRSAEDATKYVGDILIKAIQEMTIQDAFAILSGGDFAATEYLKQKTSAQLTATFKPIVTQSLQRTDATKYWKEAFSAYNQFAQNKVETDLPQYVTQKALDGLFYHIGLEEQKIRKDPVARVTDLLKKIFGSPQNLNRTNF